MAQVPQTFLDGLAVRTWCGLALRALGRARAEIDAINVYPVADGDTGTNLYLTVESAATAVEAVFAGYETRPGYETQPAGPTLADAVRAMAHGALIGARGNSGTILAQLLRGMAQVLAADGAQPRCDGPALRLALRRAADSARQAVAHPVEGTVLTVASAAADAAERADGDCGTVARAAHEGARAALAATPAQLSVLARAGVVDAGAAVWWRCSARWWRRARGRRWTPNRTEQPGHRTPCPDPRPRPNPPSTPIPGLAPPRTVAPPSR